MLIFLMVNRTLKLIISTHLTLLAGGDLYCLLITFANILDPDQDRQKVGPDLDPNHLTLIVLPKDFFGNVTLEKISTDNNIYPACKELS